jgi:hypothetical protein
MNDITRRSRPWRVARKPVVAVVTGEREQHSAIHRHCVIPLIIQHRNFASHKISQHAMRAPNPLPA